MKLAYSEQQIGDLVIHQLKGYWPDIDEETIRAAVPDALNLMDMNFRELSSRRFSCDGEAVFNPLMSTHWMIFLYRLSHLLFKRNGGGRLTRYTI